MGIMAKRLWNVVALAGVLTCAILFFVLQESRYRLSGERSPPIPTSDEGKPKIPSPIEDNFPLIAGLTAGKLPAVPSWNRPPTPHATEKTPLFIGFTRNWPLLQQCVLSYITAGWPPEDIIVVDNTGTMKSNYPPNPKITLQNPFYLNVQRLTDVFGVKVISTPTLLSFAQLQNFYIFTALDKGWEYYFWSHMDILAVAEERWPETPYLSLYGRALAKLREATGKDYLRNPETGVKDDWAIQFFAYDWLALNKVESFMKVGGWDTFVSYYTTDCDMHGRFTMRGVKMPAVDAGRISDVGSSIDLNLLFRKKFDPAKPPKTVEEMDQLPEDERGGPGFDTLTEAVQVQIQGKKNGQERNMWQYKQVGGQGEPFYRDPKGFEHSLQMAIKAGVDTYHAKWDTKECNVGTKTPDDEWKSLKGEK